jgi:phage-related tail protein
MGVKISDLRKKIKKLEDALYKQIEMANKMEEDRDRYKFQLETAYTKIEDLNEEIAGLKRQLQNER